MPSCAPRTPSSLTKQSNPTSTRQHTINVPAVLETPFISCTRILRKIGVAVALVGGIVFPTHNQIISTGLHTQLTFAPMCAIIEYYVVFTRIEHVEEYSSIYSAVECKPRIYNVLHNPSTSPEFHLTTIQHNKIQQQSPTLQKKSCSILLSLKRSIYFLILD